MKQYIVDAFTDKLFGGNPAAVCIADSFHDDKLMQDIASENNLSETAFAVREDGGYRLRLGALHDSPLLVQETRQDSITAFQASLRTGVLNCTACGDRVKISGKAVLFSAADIKIR